MSWLSWQVVSCPKCGSPKGEKCRTLTTNRSTDSHEVRRTLAASEWVKW